MITTFLSLALVASLLGISEEQAAVHKWFPERELFLEAAQVSGCESKMKHFENGEPLKNREGSSAIGMFQIMSSLHEKNAKSMGMDIRTIDGNAQFARYLYDDKGWWPWLASNECHHLLPKKLAKR